MSIYIYLIAKPYSNAEKDPTKNQHGFVFSSTAESSSGQEKGRRQKNGGLATKYGAQLRCEKTGNEGSEVQGRREELKHLVVVLAVVVFYRAKFSFVHLGKEFDQEVVHPRNTT